MKIGLKKISELSGFSIATISNVLKGKKGVNANTAKKVLAIAREIGYLKEGKVDKVRFVIYKKHGLVVGETPFFQELMEGVESECRTRNLPLEVVHLSPSDRDFDEMMRKIIQDPSTATLVLATELEQKDLEPFNKSVGSVAILDSYYSNMRYNATCINNVDSLIQAVNLLVEHGYSDFGYLKSSVSIYNFKAREEGYRKGLTRNNLPIDEKKIVLLSPNTEGAYQDMMKFLSGAYTLPRIYLSDNDMIALGAMKAMLEKGIKIPEDVSIVGFDDVEYTEISTPTLSTIRVFKKELGALGVRNLLDTLESNITAKTTLSTEFVPRDSIYSTLTNI